MTGRGQMTAQLLPLDSMTGDTALFGTAEHGDTDAPQMERATSNTRTEVKRIKLDSCACKHAHVCMWFAKFSITTRQANLSRLSFTEFGPNQLFSDLVYILNSYVS